MFDSSQEEMQSIIHSFLDTYSCPGDADAGAFINYILSINPTQTAHSKSPTQEEAALITPPAKLEVREANPDPEPQNGNDCSAQASRSATDAIRQANQQASEQVRQASQSASQAVQQATQQASQAVQQASQSATNAIRQAQNEASQSIDQASRSSSSISSSAASAQASADQAVSRANESARIAVSNASQAILQASAAVAAATGSAAKAASSFLDQATKINQGTLPSFASGQQQNAEASTSCQNVAVTAPQIALAIIGSIIASTLITFLIYYFIRRHRKKAQQSRHESWRSRNFEEGKATDRKSSYASSEKSSSSRSFGNFKKETAPGLQRSNSGASDMTYFRFPNFSAKNETSAPKQDLEVKETYIPWNSRKQSSDPNAGGTWLTPISSIVSPFGSIKLPTGGGKGNAPLGGQLRSPLFSTERSGVTRGASDLPLRAPQIQLPPPIAEREFTPAVQQQQYTPSFYSEQPGPSVQRPSIRTKDRRGVEEAQRAVPDDFSSPTERKKSLTRTQARRADNDGDVESFILPKQGRRSSVGGTLDPNAAKRGQDRIKENQVEWPGYLAADDLNTPDTGGIGSARILDAVRGVVVVPRKMGRPSVVQGSGLRGRAL